MTDVTQLLKPPTVTGQRELKIVAGYVSLERTPPAGPNDPIWVIVPSHGEDNPYGPLAWPVSWGATLPVPGTQVWVGIDDNGTPFVSGWVGVYSAPEPGGAAGGVLGGLYPDPAFATAWAEGMMAALQPGVVVEADLNPGMVVTGTYPACVFNVELAAVSTVYFCKTAGGLLTPVPFAGFAGNLTPGTLPPSSGNIWRGFGVNVDTAGAVTLQDSGSNSANEAAAFTAIGSTAAPAGTFRVFDIALENSGSAFLFATRDRRPWAHGAQGYIHQSGSSVTTNIASFAPMDFALRVECSGVPLRVKYTSSCATIATAAPNNVIETAIFVDGIAAGTVLVTICPPINEWSLLIIDEMYIGIAAGSHLFSPGWLVGGGNTIQNGAASFGDMFEVSEVIGGNTNNGTS